jgi:endonuclease YncB( thermonuclease family)
MASVEHPVDAWVTAIPDAWCIQHDIPQTGRVVEVVDGDTIRVLLDSDGRVHSVRYLGIDAPGLKGDSADWGRAAWARNSELVYHKQAVLVRDITDSDAGGTLLRYVLMEDVFVNHAMIRDGLAIAAVAAPDTSCLNALLAAEQQARAEARGIWGLPAATPTP